LGYKSSILEVALVGSSYTTYNIVFLLSSIIGTKTCFLEEPFIVMFILERHFARGERERVECYIVHFDCLLGWEYWESLLDF